MTKITVWETPFAGHQTTAKHEYSLSEGIYSISYSKETRNVIVKFDSCRDVLSIPADDLKMITLQSD